MWVRWMARENHPAMRCLDPRYYITRSDSQENTVWLIAMSSVPGAGPEWQNTPLYIFNLN